MLIAGPASVILIYLSPKDQLIFNLLCKRFYYVIMPGLKTKMEVEKEFPDFLNWGSDSASLRRIVNTFISGMFGDYYGECQLKNNQLTPQGRGLLVG